PVEILIENEIECAGNRSLTYNFLNLVNATIIGINKGFRRSSGAMSYCALINSGDGLFRLKTPDDSRCFVKGRAFVIDIKVFKGRIPDMPFCIRCPKIFL